MGVKGVSYQQRCMLEVYVSAEMYFRGVCLCICMSDVNTAKQCGLWWGMCMGRLQQKYAFLMSTLQDLYIDKHRGLWWVCMGRLEPSS